jgi:isocitrate/isopropylmalate dehydrogenase
VIIGADIMVVRELTGGIYFGRKSRTAHEAEDVCTYTTDEVERVTKVAGRLAMGRRRRIVSVDKANVLETSRLWRAVVERVLRDEFPEVEFEHMLVDAAAMHLIRRPASFDVLLTENMFGDILRKASMLCGSMGCCRPLNETASDCTSRCMVRRRTSPAGRRQSLRHAAVGGHDAAPFAGPPGRADALERAIHSCWSDVDP